MTDEQFAQLGPADKKNFGELHAKIKELEARLARSHESYKLQHDLCDELREKLAGFTEHHEKMCFDYTDRINALSEKLAEAENLIRVIYTGAVMAHSDNFKEIRSKIDEYRVKAR